jgi:hypothetical protein
VRDKLRSAKPVDGVCLSVMPAGQAAILVTRARGDSRRRMPGRGCAGGASRAAGHVHGHQAIELTETPAGHYQPLPTLLWVNAHTYLPLRMLNGAGTRDGAQMDWYDLRPTPAHLALLRVPILPGYPRSGG